MDAMQYIKIGIAGIQKSEYAASAIDIIISKTIDARHPPPLVFDVFLIVFPLSSFVFIVHDLIE